MSPTAPLAYAQGTATISVTVTDGSGAPLANASVVLFNSQGRRLSSASVGPNVSFTHNVPPGSYTLLGSAPGYATELYNDVPCPHVVCEPTSGTPFSLASGESFTAGIILAPEGRIAGVVRRAAGGSVIPGTSVRVYNSFGVELAVAYTESDGAYAFGGLSAGTYYLRTVAFSLSGPAADYLDELYGGAECVSLSGQPACRVTRGTPVVVASGAESSGIDFSLDPGGTIDGTVASVPGGAPQPGVTVRASVGGAPFGSAVTDFSGHYTITGLPSAIYTVRTETPWIRPLVDEWFDDVCVGCPGTPRGVLVTAGTTTSGINFGLMAGGSIAGTLSFPTLPFPGWVAAPSVNVYDSRNVLVRSVAPTLLSGSTGSYVPAVPAGGTFTWRAEGLPAGRYYVRTSNAAEPGVVSNVPSPSSGWLIDELYDNAACVTIDCLPTQGTPVTVATGAETTGIDFALEYGAVITGSVRRAAPLGSQIARVRIYDSRGVELVRSRGREHSRFVTGPPADPAVYAASGLPAGTYYLKMDRTVDGRFASELYADTSCDACPVTSGRPVVVRAGEARAGIDFTGLTPYGFSGRVEALATGTGLPGVTINAYTQDHRLVASAISGFGGRFYVRGLSGGNYIYRTVNQSGFVEGEGAVATPTSGGADTCCVTIALAAGQAVSGTVRDSAGGPIPNTPVSAFTSSFASPVARATTNSFGDYSLTLPPDAYGIFTDPVAGFRQEIYNDVACPFGVCDQASATRVTVSSAAVTGVNFSLAACSSMSIAPLRLANAAVGSAYRQTLVVAGGLSGARFHIAGGAVPPGLTLDGSSGVIAGTPSSAGAFSFAVSASDAAGCATTRDYSLDVPACAFILEQSSVSLRARGEPWLIPIARACGAWTATPSDPWIQVSGSGSSSVLIIAAPNTSPSARSGFVTIGPRVFTVHQSGTIAASPFGFVDTPLEAAIVRGSIAVTGWALDDLAVMSVQVFRDPVAGEPLGQELFVGDATFVEGARPDVERLYGGAYPRVRRAGWGYLLLSNMLPGNGNGTFRLHVYALDSDGQRTPLGTRTIVAANSTADAPFGAIDTPAQGETISGFSYINWGWALTPQPNMIPAAGTSIQVHVDGVALGTVAYNLFRPDVSGLFPGLKNSGGPVGYRVIDTTTLSEGVHTISWVATDDAGRASGIGSRYFTVNNSAWNAATATGALRGEPAQVPFTVAGVDLGRRSAGLSGEPLSAAEIGLRRDETGNWLELVGPTSRGERAIAIRELERIELDLAAASSDSCASTYAGYLAANGELRELPVGSALDAAGRFYWQPGPGFVGTYRLLFVRTACDGSRERLPVRITIGAR